MFFRHILVLGLHLQYLADTLFTEVLDLNLNLI